MSFFAVSIPAACGDFILFFISWAFPPDPKERAQNPRRVDWLHLLAEVNILTRYLLRMNVLHGQGKRGLCRVGSPYATCLPGGGEKPANKSIPILRLNPGRPRSLRHHTPLGIEKIFTSKRPWAPKAAGHRLSKMVRPKDAGTRFPRLRPQGPIRTNTHQPAMNRLVLQFTAQLHLKKYSENSILNHRLDLLRFKSWLEEKEMATLPKVQQIAALDIMEYQGVLAKR